MRYVGIAAAAAVLAAVGVWTIFPERPAAGADAKADAAALVKRGDYLVNEVARCGECHTPRDRRGRPDATRALQGGEVPFAPKVKAGEWEGRAPDITTSGKSGKWSEAMMVKLLTTGNNGEGEAPDAPMPAYHLTDDDARAVTAYLRSLPGGGDKGGERDKEKDKEKGKEKGKEKDKERDKEGRRPDRDDDK
jgi:mono/diheme cytochrome c family protein